MSLFICGENTYNKLGVDSNISPIFNKPFSLPRQYEKIEYGEDFAIAIDVNGKLFSWGKNNYNQLGLKVINTKSVVQEIIFNDLNIVFKNIKCGRDFVYAMTTGGDIYFWGNNQYGQLGIDPSVQNLVMLPQKWSDFNFLTNGDKIADIQCGFDFTLFLTTLGIVYSFGNNAQKQLGRNNPVGLNNYYPKQFYGISTTKFSKISASRYHSFAVGINGNTLQWGSHESNTFGNDSIVVQEVYSNSINPIFEIPSGNSTDIYQKIVCGYYNTILLRKDGTIEYYGEKQNVDLKNFLNNGEKIIDIFAGSDHNIVLTDQNNLIVWGNNMYGQLFSTNYGILDITKITNYNLNSIKTLALGNNCTIMIVNQTIATPPTVTNDQPTTTISMPNVQYSRIITTPFNITDGQSQPQPNQTPSVIVTAEQPQSQPNQTPSVIATAEQSQSQYQTNQTNVTNESSPIQLSNQNNVTNKSSPIQLSNPNNVQKEIIDTQNQSSNNYILTFLIIVLVLILIFTILYTYTDLKKYVLSFYK